MKKFFFIMLTTAALTFTLTACTKKVDIENNGTASTVNAQAPADQKSAVDTAKSQGDEPVPENIRQKDEELTKTTSPKGLTLTISTLPNEKLEQVGVTGTVHGPYSNRMMYDSMVFIQVERLNKAKEGNAGIEAAIREIHADLQLRELTIEKTDIAQNISAPVYKITYITGQNEDTKTNLDYYIVGDKFDFRLHTSCGADFVDDYKEMIDKLGTGMLLQENNSEG